MKIMYFIVLLTLCLSYITRGEEPKGNISGKVTESGTGASVFGVNVIIKNQKLGTTTDPNGQFEIKKIPVGLVNVTFSCIGYRSITKTDINIKPDRTVNLNIEMIPAEMELAEVVVSNGYFSELENKPVSTVNFSAEEVRRSPGTAGDVSRILFTLPSVAKVNDQRNSLIVRGGTAVENSFYIDNIEIPNINHFPVEGSSDGPIGILNADFIEDIDFHSGGFSAVYGDKLSSVMNIKFREDKNLRFSPKINLNMAGFGAALEGSIGEKGSYLFSANRSYIDLIVNQIEEGAPLPRYGDAQGKVSYEIDNNNKLTFLDIFSIDEIYMDEEEAVKNNANIFGKTNGITNTTGLNWYHQWSDKGFSNTSLSYIFNHYNRDYSKTSTLKTFYINKSIENNFRLRNVNYYKLNRSNSLEFGFDVLASLTNFDTYYGEYDDQWGNKTLPLIINKYHSGIKFAAFLVHHLSFTEQLTLDYGLRTDYFTYNKNLTVSPRAALTYRFSDKVSASFSAGLFQQEIPNNIMVQSEEFKFLKTPSALHYIAGVNWLPGKATRISLEAYYKKYYNFPVNPDQPTIFLFDQVQVFGIFWSNNKLIDNGKADSKGIELILQKKLAEDFYGLLSASYSNSEYTDQSGIKYSRIYDNRINLNLEGGYIPSKDWEIKIRWIYAGGAPYTPFDYSASKAAKQGIWDQSKTNGERLPDYHSMNLRVDKRFYFNTSSILLYLSVWNVYNRKNVAAYYWNEVKNDIDKQTQWSVLPVLGVEWEF